LLLDAAIVVVLLVVVAGCGCRRPFFAALAVTVTVAAGTG